MPLHKCLNPKQFSFVLLIFFYFQQAIVSADQKNNLSESKTQNNKRPKIGLVLSGGGARGFAHIGVLKVLEENNVPIDFVVGTSMGSIVGGLYALGLTPEEIENGVKGIAWEDVFDDFANRDYKSFRRKQDDFDFYNIHRVGITDDGLQISPGLIEGQQIELALDRLAYSGFQIEDFDKFKIPYRAIATNLENGEPFIIKSGNIARAMRASMSIPGALPPITIGDTLLVDGGIANNIPIDIVRDMGADIVIVVDVSEPLADKEDIKSGIDVAGQLTTILTRRIANIELKTLKGKDVLIIPGEKEVSSSDFEKHEILIKAGELAAMKKLSSIKQLSISIDDYSAYHSNLPVVANKSPVIDFIEINNKTSLRDEIMRVRIHQKIGEPLDIAQLEQDLSYIYGLDYSGSVVYSVEKRDDQTGLIVYVRDRQWAHSYLQFGFAIETAIEIQSINNYYVSYNKNNLNSLAGEFRAIGSVGSEPQVNAELYQPLNAELDYFVSAKAGINTSIVPTLIDGQIESLQRFNRSFITLTTGKIYKQTTELSLGLSYNDGKINAVTGPEIDGDSSFIESYYTVKLFHDSLDNLSFPNSGLFGTISYRDNRKTLGADNDFRQMKFEFGGAGTFGRYTIFSRALFETTLDNVSLDNKPANELLFRGGYLELSGTVRNELFGQHFGLIEAVFYRRLGDITFFPIYTGFSLEAGNAWLEASDINTENIRLAGSVFIGADTFLGPIYIAIGATDKGESAFYLNIGVPFLKNN
ncbi:putative patatin-like phospholipase [hydrothermal vent metagenome]|uniref:Putative patatin-like phospholipase n=1 Tax=hydrothermal vent metagenome TaxID=652676 RepID=A0A3B0X256_9ZZZZ